MEVVPIVKGSLVMSVKNVTWRGKNMKIKITTVREIHDNDFLSWIKAVNMGNPLHPINGNNLLKHRKIEYTSHSMVDNGRSTSETTTYEILE
jgi:hypothetical protein